MATGPFRNPGEGVRTPDQSSNQGKNLEKGTTATPDQSTQYESGAKLMELLQSSVLQSPVLSERSGFFMVSVMESGKFVTQLEGSLRNILQEKLQSPNISDEYKTSLEKYLAQLNSNTGAFELKTIIKIAFECIELSEINEVDPTDLARFVVEIADDLKALMSTITRSTQFPYETRASSLYEFISLMVELISNVGPRYSILRGRELAKAQIDHPNNALLEALYNASDALLSEAAKAGPQKLIDAISSLLEMTNELQRDELKSIYFKILAQIYFTMKESVMKNGGIDDNLIEQLIDWYINYFATVLGEIDYFVLLILGTIPSDLNLKLPKILYRKLVDRARKTRITYYRYLASRLWECYLDPNREWKDKIARLEGKKTELEGWNARLEGRIAKLEEENAELRRKLKELTTQVQRQIGIQTDEEK